MTDCVHYGCRHILNVVIPDSFQIVKVCQDCKRRVCILTFEQPQWDELVAEGRILVQ